MELQVFNPRYSKAVLQKREFGRRYRERMALERQINEAREAIKKANQALRRLHSTDGEVGVIIDRICGALGVPRAAIMADRRNKRLVFARHAVIYWVCRRTRFSLPQIGRMLGGRDHTTILHAKKSYVAKRAAMGRTLREVL